MTKPITPQELEKFDSVIPDEVFDVVNSILLEKRQFGGESLSRIMILQEDVVKKLVQDHNFARQDIYAKHMLDFEPHYRKAGWNVVFDRPGYCESYAAYWVFSQ